MGLIELLELTTKHHDPKGVNDALTLLGVNCFADYNQSPLSPVKQLYVNYRQDTPPLSGVCLLSGRRNFDYTHTAYQKSGKPFAVHAG